MDAEQTAPHLVLYDGTCGFCHASVRWILARDAHHRFCYAPLQGETAARIRARHPGLPEDTDSVLLVMRFRHPDERVFWRSVAVLRICRLLGGVWVVPGLLHYLPSALTDLCYMAVARVRHRLFPPPDACSIPSEPERARFLP